VPLAVGARWLVTCTQPTGEAFVAFGAGGVQADDLDGRHRLGRTRATRPGRTGRGCASAASPRRSRNVTTRSPTAASDLAARSTSVTSSGSGTAAATSSSASSTSPSSGAGSRCDQTRPPATTTPVSASPPHSTGSRPLATRPNQRPGPGQGLESRERSVDLTNASNPRPVRSTSSTRPSTGRQTRLRTLLRT
jgi:hypothetical protein